MENGINIANLNVKTFAEFVKDKCFTVEFFKKPETPEEIAANRGAYRMLNARLKVKKYVKGTQPEATAKRKETNTERNQIGVYEMRGSSQRFEAANYRTIPLGADRLISLVIGGIKYQNPSLKID